MECNGIRGFLVGASTQLPGFRYRSIRATRFYTATESGQTTLQIGKDRVRELLRVLIEEDDS
ncbi:MAG: hypothetical protein Q8M09_04550 [Pseudomonadota bacterium]|nr:hypothetical protein [Pseudomonadota bacterium]MDP1903508.1 hypothetical protein [Pseudomonadota bacterium]MDP2351535.1 hypothetical protein [Pseudomonadota bacterium]